MPEAAEKNQNVSKKDKVSVLIVMDLGINKYKIIIIMMVIIVQDKCKK